MITLILWPEFKTYLLYVQFFRQKIFIELLLNFRHYFSNCEPDQTLPLLDLTFYVGERENNL